MRMGHDDDQRAVGSIGEFRRRLLRVNERHISRDVSWKGLEPRIDPTNDERQRRQSEIVA